MTPQLKNVSRGFSIARIRLLVDCLVIVGFLPSALPARFLSRRHLNSFGVGDYAIIGTVVRAYERRESHSARVGV